MNIKRHRTQLSFLIIVLLGFCLYGNMLTVGAFYWDDKSAIQNNFLLTQPIDLVRIFKAFNTRFMTGLSFVLNTHLTGLNAQGFRIISVIIHIMSAFAVYGLADITLKTPRMKEETLPERAPWIPLIASLIFLAHPLQTESLNLITQRYTLIGGFFYITAVYCYAAARVRRFKRMYVLAFITAVAAMFSKEFCFTLPLAMALYEFLFIRRRDEKWSSHIGILIPYLCTMLIIPILLVRPQTNMHSTARISKVFSVAPEETGFLNTLDRISRTEAEISRKMYFLTQLHVLRTYTRLLFWPSGQNADYDYPLEDHFWNVPTVLSALYLLALLILAFFLRNRWRLAAFGILWFFLTLSLESSVIPIGYVINEHRLYLAVMGYAFIIAELLTRLFKNEKMLLVASVLIISGLSIATVQRNAVWKDEITLWEDTCPKSPHKARVWTNLGIAYKENGQIDKAVEALSHAIELDPANPVAYTYLGFCRRHQGDLESEVSLLKKAIEVNPGYAMAYFGLGYHYQARGLHQEAIPYYEQAIALDQGYASVYKNLAVAYAQTGQPEKIQRLIEGLNAQGNVLMSSLLSRYLANMAAEKSP